MRRSVSLYPNCCIPLPCSCAVCIFPAVGDIVSFVFSVLYLFLFWRTTRRMSAAIINKHMHLRLRVFQFSAMSGELEGLCVLGDCWQCSAQYFVGRVVSLARQLGLLPVLHLILPRPSLCPCTCHAAECCGDLSLWPCVQQRRPVTSML